MRPDRDSDDSCQRRLDASGLECPEPAFRARQALDSMAPGEVLEVVATDPLAEVDLRLMCERAGHHLLEIEHGQASMVIRIRKG